MRVQVVTLFPEQILGAANHSILARAQASGKLALGCTDPREYASNRHRTVDDYPFGGGAGMVLKPEPLARAIEAARGDEEGVQVILLTPDGEPLTQAIARELSQEEKLVLVCGHYEGVDERVREGWITREISIGDYVLTGGELAALVVLDAVVRLLPGVLGNEHSASEESFQGGLLEYPHYTRPAEFEGRGVPDVLLSGHHAQIEKWRRQQSLVRTRARRPDLFDTMLPLSRADQKLLDDFDAQQRRAEESSVQVGPSVSEEQELPPETAGGCAASTQKEK